MHSTMQGNYYYFAYARAVVALTNVVDTIAFNDYLDM